MNWILLKDGIILKYGVKGNVTLAKLYAQEAYYVNEDGGAPFLYALDEDGQPKVIDGIVIMRIYSGWVKTYSKK